MALVAGAVTVSVSPAGAAAWSVLPSASPAGSSSAGIYDVACPTTTSCFAVGFYATATTGSALAEHWDGTGWSLMSLPAGAEASRSISCPSPTSCFAVGGSGLGLGAARWNGTTWSTLSLADPGTGSDAFISSVACSSDTSCFVVGGKGRNSVKTLVESWNGVTWSIVPSPTVIGSDSFLNDVTCASASSCVAVGTASDSSAGQTLIEQWDGSAWSMAASPTPDGGGYASLSSVSCPSATSCFAAGGFAPSSGNAETLIEEWDGDTWFIDPSPNVAGSFSDFFLGVSCTSATSCFAAGAVVLTNLGPTQSLIERWNGTSWTISSSPNPDARFNELRGVGCASASLCFAVGDRGEFSQAGLVERWNGSSWSATSDPPFTPTPPDATLAGVACASATKCFGVGGYTNTAGNRIALIERPAGTSWSIIASPSKAGGSDLSGVSCPSATTCFAVGRSGTGGAWKTFIERWNGSAWSIMPSPNVSRSKNFTPNTLSSVSCSSATNCFAVGNSLYGPFNTLTEHWDGKKWTVVPSPNRTKTGDSALEGVSCTSPTSCIAVGRSSANTNNHASSYRTLTERWNGSTWTIVSSPNAASGSGELASVSCATATACVAVGNAVQNSSRKSLIETWNGSTWTRVTSADPTGAIHSALDGVSCPSTKSCVAVGFTSGASGLSKTMVKTLAGGHWSTGSAATPQGAQNSSLQAVSCLSPSSCFAVGTYDTTGAPLTLVERSS